MDWWSSGHAGELIGWWRSGFCQGLHAYYLANCPGVVDYASVRVLSFRGGNQSSTGDACPRYRLFWRNLVGEKLDLVSRFDKSPARSALRCKRRIHSDR